MKDRSCCPRLIDVHPARVRAARAVLSLPLIWENCSLQELGTVLCCRYCFCQPYSALLPKACNCRMFCCAFPPATYYLRRSSRVTSRGLIVITEKAWGEEFCLYFASRGLSVYIFSVICWEVSLYRAVRRPVKSFEILQRGLAW